MKKNEKKMILLLIVVAIIIIAVLVRSKNNSNGNVVNSNNNNNNPSNPIADTTTEKEEFVQVLDDGTKLNTSTKLSETKTFGNYEVSNIQLTEQGGQSLILADVKNISDAKTDVALVDITLLDKDGNEIITIGGIIGDAEPGETVQLNSSATTDFSNAYDFSIKIANPAE